MYGCIFSFNRHHFLQDSSFFCIVHCSVRFSVLFLSFCMDTSCQNSSCNKGCGATDELHQLPGCMAVVQLFSSASSVLPILIQFFSMFCHDFLPQLSARCRCWIGPWTFKTCTSADFEDSQNAQPSCVASCSSCQLCSGVMLTIRGWCPLSRKLCKDIWMSSACRQTVCKKCVGDLLDKI